MTTICDRDGCANLVEETNRHHILTHVRGTRVSVLRVWCFCSEDCRSSWWSTPDASNLCPDNPEEQTSEEYGGVTPFPTATETDFVVDVWHQTKNTAPELSESNELQDNSAINTWWQS